jgi:hypothetical protein
MLTELPLSSNEEVLVMVPMGARANALPTTINAPKIKASDLFRM